MMQRASGSLGRKSPGRHLGNQRAQSSGGPMSPLRKLLYSLIIIGAVSSTVSAGTFASFTASTTNATSTFATGTMVLNRQLGATTCISAGGSSTIANDNLNSTCSAIIDVTRQKIDDPVTAIDLNLENQGDLGGDLYLVAEDVDLVTGGVQACLSEDATDTYYNPSDIGVTGGDVCANLDLVIQEYTDAGRLTAYSKCAFPYNAVSACSIGGVSDRPSNLPTTATDLDSLPALSTRWFRVFMQAPDDLDNTFQGRRLTFKLSWTLQ